MSNQQTWRERIKAVASASEPTTPTPLAQTLEDFRATLDESPWIRAELRTMGHPRRRSLIVYPKHRRDISAMMLTFWLDRDAVRVMGAGGEEFDDAEKLGLYLADFAEKSAFPDTVAEYRELQGKDVNGVLRVKGLGEDDAADVPVLVGAAEHNELAKRALEKKTDTPLALSVAIQEHPRVGKFDAATRYTHLESGGFALRLAPGALQRTGEALRLHGDVVPLEELRI